MKVILDEQLFSESVLVRSSMHLLSIFRLGFERRHAIVLGFARTAGCLFNDWLCRRPAYEQEAIEGAIRYGRQSEVRDVLDNVIRVVSDEDPLWTHNPPRLPAAIAADLLAKPLELLVEDAVSDQDFIQSVAVGPQTPDFKKFVDKQWIRFVNGGGVPNMLRQIENLQGRPDSRRRIWVVFDSDALAPDLPPHSASQELIDLCTTSVISYHCLWRRAMENYLPPDYLMACFRGDPLESVADAFQRLTDSGQHHHYNMKIGFEGDQARINESDAQTQEVVKALFDGISMAERAALRNGFGRKVGELFKTDNGKRPPGLTEDMLLRYGVGDEMKELLAGIMAWV